MIQYVVASEPIQDNIRRGSTISSRSISSLKSKLRCVEINRKQVRELLFCKQLRLTKGLLLVKVRNDELDSLLQTGGGITELLKLLRHLQGRQFTSIQGLRLEVKRLRRALLQEQARVLVNFANYSYVGELLPADLLLLPPGARRLYRKG